MPIAAELQLTYIDLGSTYAQGFASSLLAASEAVGGREWLLCTPDHLIDTTLISRMRRVRLSESGFDAVALIELEPVDRHRRGRP